MIYTIKNPVFEQKQFKYLGYILGIVSPYLIINDSYMYSLMSIVALGLISLSDGFQIDVANKKHRDYLSVFWLKLGKWKTLEEVKTIRVFQYDTVQNVAVSSIMRSVTESNYKMTIETNSGIIDGGNFKTMEKAKAMANKIAGGIGIEVEVC